MNNAFLGRGEPDPGSTSRPAVRSQGARRSTRRTVAAVVAPLVASAGMVGIASPAHAAIDPVAPPHDIGVFPMRDFLGVGGWGVGAEMEVRVIRDGVQIGSAGPMTLAADAELNGFAEVNHPGGVCWNGVTPNLIAGDRIEAIDADGNGDFTVVQNVEVTQPATLVDADKDGAVDDIVVRGMASNVAGTGRIDPGLVEQRIINPDLDDTSIGRRDVRAIFGSGGVADGVTTRGQIRWDDPAPGSTDPHWTATYLNMNEVSTVTGETSGELAVAGQSRMLAWERTNTAGDRIGMTLWEYGEVGGPGMGGCPAGDNYAVGGASPKNINIATSQQANLTLSGTATNVDTVTVSVDDHDPATAPVTGTATVAKPTSLNTAIPMAGNTTWSAQLPMAQILARFPGNDTLVASATFGLVQETTTDRDTDGDPNTPMVPVTERTSSPIGGATLNILKDLTAPAKPTAFPGIDGGTVRSTSAQSVTVSPANEIEDVVRYRVGATTATTADPTAASPIVPLPLSVTTTQTVKVRSYDPAGNPSPVATYNYFIGANTAPAAPTNVSATGGNAQATVSWTAPTDDGGSAITGYIVETYQGTAFVKRNAFNTTGTSVVVSGLTNGTAYNFRVRAVNAIGQGPLSTASAAVTPTGTTVTAPGAPTIGTAVAGDARATVNWTAPTNTGGAAITEYRIQVRTGTTIVRTVSGIAGTASSSVVTGLTNGTAYNFRVRAVNSAGVGALSLASNVVTPGAAATVPGAPTIGTAASGAAGGTITATARWTAPANNGGSAITGYVVRWQRLSSTNTVLASGTVTAGATATSLSPTLPVTGRYRFAVRAQNAVGLSVFSANSNIVTAQ